MTRFEVMSSRVHLSYLQRNNDKHVNITRPHWINSDVYWYACLLAMQPSRKATFKASISINSLFHKAQTVPLILISCFVTCAIKSAIAPSLML